MLRRVLPRQLRLPAASSSRRALHLTPRRRAEDRDTFDPANVERASDDVDVCIVGAGPAGLSAAIRLKQLEKERGRDVRVVVLEKGSEVGAHILSGAVIEPRALDELLPDWKTMEGHPLTQPATSSTMRWLTATGSYPMPHPPQMNNTGNYVVSLSQFTAWLGGVAEAEGVEIYPGFAGAGAVYTDDGTGVLGVVTNEVGLDRKFRMKDSFEPGMEFRAKVTLVAEGAHGSLSKVLQNKFRLRDGRDPQTYGIGVKEVWRVRPEVYEAGKTVHTMGWPLTTDMYGGSWLYHMADGMVSVGLVIGLDYPNPYVSPYKEFQRMKHHPYFKSLLEGGECLAYGARTLNEGGFQSIPKLHFPGGALIGCSAGFLNVPKIKGTHNAMKSGMLAAEAAYDALGEEVQQGQAADMSAYEEKIRQSWVWSELREVRNLRPSFAKFGFWGGLMYSGVDSLITKGRTPWTLHTTVGDAEHTKKARDCKPIDYPPPQPPLSFDILTSVSLTGTNHAEDQPVHLRLNAGVDARKQHVRENVEEYAGLLGRACPASVYEYVEQDAAPAREREGENVEEVGWGGKKLVINSQNCIHCKLCDIKVPTQDINWTVPEGGGGPKYSLT